MTLVKSLNKHFLIILVSVNLSNATHLEGITCDFADEENLVRNLTQELECCNITVQQYYLNWDRGSHYLTTFLNTLQTWECPQFKEECEKETFAYTDFTELVYLTFCERSLMETQCRDDLLQEVEKQSGNLAESFSFTELAQSLNSSEISDGDLIKPCLQVAMLVANEPSSGRFQEIINPLAPLCSSFIWCGFDQNVITSRDISMWTCMPSECYVNIIVTGVFCGIFALATILCNFIVLAVFGFNKNLMNGTAIYKISIAVGDFVVGAAIFPTFVSLMVTSLLQRRVLGELNNVTTYVPIQNESNLTQIFFPDVHDSIGGLITDRVSQTSLNAIGFLTTLSLCVSLYSLAAASVDRYVAVRHPLKYRKSASTVAARRVVIGIWIVATIFSSVPLFIENLRYRSIASIFVTSGGSAALILYALAFILPLLTMWVVSLATFCAFRTHNRKTSHMMSTSKEANKTTMLEMKLARTLGIMVGVFTLCLLPIAIVLILPFLISGISIFDPETLSEKATTSYTTAEAIVVILLTTNSLWNFFIYSARDVKFWNATKDLFSHLTSTVSHPGRASSSGLHIKSLDPKRTSRVFSTKPASSV